MLVFLSHLLFGGERHGLNHEALLQLLLKLIGHRCVQYSSMVHCLFLSGHESLLGDWEAPLVGLMVTNFDGGQSFPMHSLFVGDSLDLIFVKVNCLDWLVTTSMTVFGCLVHRCTKALHGLGSYAHRPGCRARSSFEGRGCPLCAIFGRS